MTNRTGTLSRDDATRRVMKTLALTNSPASFPHRLADGSTPIVVALPNEYVSDVMNRVSSMGGNANVAVAFRDHFQTVVLGTSLKGNESEVVEINQDISMGMFLIRVTANPGKRMRFRFRNINADVPEVSLEMAYS